MSMKKRKDHLIGHRPPFECIALVLQGGGALGAYQCGVYEALVEATLIPDWVAGISIGAINAALIAGNPPEKRVDRLREFWSVVTTRPFLDGFAGFGKDQGDQARIFFNAMSASAAMMTGPSGFYSPRFPSPWLPPAGSPAAV